MTNAAEEIYQQYKKSIYNYFYRSTFNSHTSEELTQDTFLKAFKYFNAFRGDSSVSTWLFKIARNTYLSYVRKYGNTREEDISGYELPDGKDAISGSDERMIVRKILHQLSEEERTIIILRDMNGFSYLEISKIMDWTEGKVKINLHRARNKFRTYYNYECKE